jgi:hypothetical protein
LRIGVHNDTVPSADQNTQALDGSRQLHPIIGRCWRETG